MAESLSLGVMSAVVGALSSSEPQFHPRTTVFMDQTPQQRLVELFEETDQVFEEDPIYESVVRPIGVFNRSWVKKQETSLWDGILTEYARETLTKTAKSLQRTGTNLYEANVSPIDQDLIRFGIQSLRRLGDFKVWWLGHFRLEQGRFFFSIEHFDYVRALQQATRLTDVGLDRLRGYRLRLDALNACEHKTQADKETIRRVMDAFLSKSEHELKFWRIASQELRILVDLRHHIADLCHISHLHLHQRGPKAITQIQYELWKLDAIDSELQAAFHEEACARQLYQGTVSRVVESATNWFANLFVGDAKEPRAFKTVVEAAKKHIKECEAALKGFEEHDQSSEQQRLEKYKEAIEQDYFFLARQIALNAQTLNERRYTWESELHRLKDYKDLTITLAEIQDQFFILKQSVAQKLKDHNSAELALFYNKIDEAEYNAFQMRLLLKEAYQKELQAAVQGMEGLIQQVKQSAIDVAKSYLLRGRFGDARSPLIDVMGMIRTGIATFCGYLREADELGRAPQNRAEVESKLIEDGHIEVRPQANVTIVGPNQETIDELALQAYQHFNTPEDYLAFVRSPDFENEDRIGIAIIFCRKNVIAHTPYWDWAREQLELEKYRAFMKTLEENRSFSAGYKSALNKELLESFRRKVLTDFNEQLSHTTSTAVSMMGSKLSSVANSGIRKAVRIYQEGTVFNQYGNFRDPKFQLLFSCKLNSKENAFNFAALFSPSPVDSEESTEPKEQKLFTPNEYRTFIDGLEFTTNPGLASIIIKYHIEGPQALHWDWGRETEELKLYCAFWSHLTENQARIPTAIQLKEKLIASFRQKVKTDHSEYRWQSSQSLVSSAGNMLVSTVKSAQRKAGRVLSLQSPLGSDPNFRDEAFQEELKVALGLAKPSKETTPQSENNK